MISKHFVSAILAITTIGSTVSIYPYIDRACAETSIQQIAQASDVERLNEEAIALFRSGKNQAALTKIAEALKIANSTKDRGGKVICFNNFGQVYQSIGTYPKAIEYYQQALTISREIRNVSEEGVALNGLGTVYTSLGEYQKSIEYFQQALKIAKEVRERIGEGSVLVNLGKAYHGLSKYQQALAAYQQALTIAKEIGSQYLESTSLNGLGTVSTEIGQYQKAIGYYQQSLAIKREIGNRQGESITLNNIGSTYETLGQYQKAIEYYQQSLVIKREIGDRNGEGTTLNNIGASYERLNQSPKAIEYFQQALVIYREVGDRGGEGTTLNNLGSAAQSLNNYPLAIKYFNQALVIHQKNGNRSQESIALGNLGLVYEDLRQYSQALQFYDRSLIIRRKIGDREGIAIALNNQGAVFYKLKKLPQAELKLREAIEIWDSLRAGLTDSNKISFADRIAITYKILQQVLVEQNKTQAALEIAERAKARALVELLASKVTTINSAASQKIRQAPNLSEIQQIARAQKATLVEYSTVDDLILIWVIKPTGKITFHQTKLPPKTTLKDLIVATRDGIGANRGTRTKDDNPNSTGGDLKQLHQLLIAPIVKDLPTKPEERVIILPQNELFLVPFAALQDAQDRYLIQQHTITIAPSIQVLALTETKSTRLSKVAPLIVGNPIMPSVGGTQLANLPGSEAEAKGIGKILQVAPLIGAQADKQKVVALMKTAPIVHLATHGLLDKIEGDIPGAIALTNGFLTSGELFDMQLSANLVVLSACDTGRGDLTGEGVVGLSRSLSVAGVPSVIVSLWEVSDEATRALMEAFYRNLQLKKLPKAQALRQAMLTTMVDYPNPNFWSAFMLVGEGR